MRRLGVELIQATTAGEGLHALQDRIPDLILTSPLLPAFDDGVLDEYLRELGAEGAHVQTLRIPVLSAVSKPSTRSLFGLGHKQATAAGSDGCDPDVFADEISEYLARAQELQLSAPMIPVDEGSHRMETAPGETASFETASFMTAPFETTSIEPEPIMSTNPFIGAGTIRRAASPIKRKEPVVARDASDTFEDDEPAAVIESMKIPEAPGTIAAPARIVAPAPVFVEPQRRVVEPPATRAPVARVEPLAASASGSRVEPPASRPKTVKSGPVTSLETALAAIRAAWVAQGRASMSSNTAKADETPIVTREIVKGAPPVESRPQAMTPAAAPTASPRVADRDEQPGPATTRVRIISLE